MSEPENFLTRWSRRKQDAESGKDDERAQPPATQTPAATGGEPIADAEGKHEEPAFDLDSLPALDSIGADTDVSGFLNPAVPLALQREALRRVWSAYPPSPELLALAEYAGDFTDTGSMAGFGALEMTDELRQLARRIVGDMAATPEGPEAADDPDPQTDAIAGQAGSSSEAAGNAKDISSIANESEDQSKSSQDESPAATVSAIPPAADAAPQYDADDAFVARVTIRRGHGGALPQ